MLNAPSTYVQSSLLEAARRYVENDRDAARLAECVFQRLCEEPDLVVDTHLVFVRAASELWGKPAETT